MKNFKNGQADLPAGTLAETGQTLLEILLAFGISILVLGAAIFVITTSLNNVQYTKNQNLATSLAQEGMAIVKQIRNSNWNNFKNLKDYTLSNTTYCLDQGSTELISIISNSPVPCGQNINSFFSRQVKFEHNSVSCASGGASGSRASIKVLWSDNKCPAGAGAPLCHKVELITCFSDIDSKQNP